MPVPVISSIAPTSPEQGDDVTITGTGFTANSTVQIGGVNVATYAYVSATSMTFIVPGTTTPGAITLRVADAEDGNSVGTAVTVRAWVSPHAHTSAMTAGAADAVTAPVAVFRSVDLQERRVAAGGAALPVLTSISPSTGASGTDITATGTSVFDGTRVVFVNDDSEIVGAAGFLSGNGTTTAVFDAPGSGVVAASDTVEVHLITGGGRSVNGETFTAPA